MKPKVSLITLGVRDLERSRRFYMDLGFECPNYDPAQGIVFFELDNGGQNGPWMSIFPLQDFADDVGVPALTSADAAHSRFHAVTLAHNEPSPADVDRVYSEAIAAGASAVKPPTTTEWGGYSGYFSDPDGHLWEVAYNPYSDLT